MLMHKRIKIQNSGVKEPKKPYARRDDANQTTRTTTLEQPHVTETQTP